ncbi:MAG: hypothetical protein D6731_04970 [Planctomycetota bacterium]|nr:MAG: hypothetical protein D6731_04970 [Planctomycetota bacterium]
MVAAPHGGYDQNTEYMARNIAGRLGYGWVRALAYRSVPLRYWYDVNRPTERPYRRGRFGDPVWTAEAQRVYDEYQQRLEGAARRSGPLDLLVEIHGHSRTVPAGGRSLRVQVIELATTGFTRTELRALKRHYEELQRSLPASQRVPLAIDRLDPHFEYRGWWIPFHFRASEAKRKGSLRPTKARRALHFELPPRVRDSAAVRSAYERLLARLIRRAAG